ncbi:HlyD family efflux transporter periplasmic adaptor subunit [Ramlibacter sp. XY19]|uniref:HlyD family efflux transporter periplasmic adaptor subunit n=1 Tax=Ramlibacter paludis TaxID=2908000 RepID=UPI0023DA66C7|nr:HlyD family efflux transporter periplasmic adaptor subunit [Ramlibacter paludis]MCG2593781.1 HlyD family efflux transporter periplasmic adaptor subunit [Ramlibacter paludis]
MDLSSPPTLPVAQAPAAPASSLLMRPVAAALGRAGLAEAAAAFGSELCELLGCARASVGLLEDGVLRLAGSSHPAELQPGQPGATALLDAMQEALDQQQVVAWPAGPEHITLAHRQLAAAGAACSIPLVDGTRVLGAVTLERAAPAFTAAEMTALADLSRLAGPVFDLKQQLALPWHRRVRHDLRERLARPSRRRLAIAGAIALVAAALAIPVPWRVSAPARLEGSVQRAVVAATDGFLQQANVRPGDRVQAGQVLAQLNSQDLELERRRRESELRQHENAYRAAQSRADRAQMVAFQAKAAEAQALLSLVETQLQRARIEAPFDGIVIKGDLSQTLGAPVQRGEVLMVLAPNDSFRLILEVDEADVGAIRPGQRGELALAAQPDRTLAFTTRRIVPVAATAEGRNFFEVEAALQEALPQLRPGLSGVAKVDAGWRPLGWLLAHRGIDWLRLAWWKVTPW